MSKEDAYDDETTYVNVTVSHKVSETVWDGEKKFLVRLPEFVKFSEIVELIEDYVNRKYPDAKMTKHEESGI